MSALLPCPFCGGEGEYDNADDSAARWIWCRGCGAKAAAEFSDEAAIAAWNQRATPAEVAALRAEVERLRGAVRSIANQKLQTEMQEDEYPIADFHGAYGAIVEVARAALTHKEPGNEG
jgi:Lar family restriction alleviation protein